MTYWSYCNCIAEMFSRNSLNLSLNVIILPRGRHNCRWEFRGSDLIFVGLSVKVNFAISHCSAQSSMAWIWCVWLKIWCLLRFRVCVWLRNPPSSNDFHMWTTCGLWSEGGQGRTRTRWRVKSWEMAAFNLTHDNWEEKRGGIWARRWEKRNNKLPRNQRWQSL